MIPMGLDDEAMMLKPKNPSQIALLSSIPAGRLEDHAEVAPAYTQLRALRIGLRLREIEKNILECSRALRGNVSASNREFFEHHQASLKAELEALKSDLLALGLPVPPESKAAVSDPVAKAFRVLAGGAPEHSETTDRQIARLDEEVSVIGDGISALSPIVDEIKRRVAGEVEAALVPEYDAIRLRLYDALVAVADVVGEEIRFIAALQSRGYPVSSVWFRRPTITAPFILGTLDNWSSQISYWRRELKDQGVI